MHVFEQIGLFLNLFQGLSLEAIDDRINVLKRSLAKSST